MLKCVARMGTTGAQTMRAMSAVELRGTHGREQAQRACVPCAGALKPTANIACATSRLALTRAADTPGVIATAGKNGRD